MNKKISFPIAIIIIIILATLVVAGILLCQYKWLSEGFQYVVPTPMATPTTSETAKWKTYRNEEYEFEMKYPFFWIFGEGEVLSPNLPDQTRNFIQINISNSVNTAQDESSLPQPGFASVIFQIGKLRESQKNFEDFVDLQLENPERGIPPATKPQLIPLAINRHKALKINQSAVGNFKREFYYVEQNLERYMTISVMWDKNEDKLVIDRILSAFRFLEGE